jgi:hypothetical protein
MTSSALLIAHAALTFGMTGIIWFVHLVHYPVMQSIETRDVSRFESLHWQKTMPLTVAMLVLELASGLALLVWSPPGVSTLQIVLGLVLIAAIWATTWVVCVPQHACLKGAYSSRAFRLLNAGESISRGSLAVAISRRHVDAGQRLRQRHVTFFKY